jgi:hypothetical protein
MDSTIIEYKNEKKFSKATRSKMYTCKGPGIKLVSDFPNATSKNKGNGSIKMLRKITINLEFYN